MNKRIGVSLGAFPRDMPYFERLGTLLDMNCKTVELMFDSPEHYVKNRNFGGAFYEYLRDLDHLSLHLPLKWTYKKDSKNERLLQEVFYSGVALNVRNYTIHPESFDMSLLPIFDGKASFENCRKKNALDNYKRLYEEHRTPWVLDTSHALSVSESHLNEMIQWHSQEGNLSQIHLSTYRGRKNHCPIIGERGLIEKVGGLGVPIILEAAYGDIDSLKRDYEYVCEVLKS